MTTALDEWDLLLVFSALYWPLRMSAAGVREMYEYVLFHELANLIDMTSSAVLQFIQNSH